MLDQISELLNRIQIISAILCVLFALLGSVLLGLKFFKNIIGMFILAAMVFIFFIAASF